MAAIPISQTPLYTDANLLHYYPLVSNTTDVIGGANGSTVTDITYTSGMFSGNSATFNGSTSQIKTSSFAGSAIYTITGWVKIITLEPDPIIIGHGTTWDTINWYWQNGFPSTNLNCGFFNDTPSHTNNGLSSVLSGGSWMMITQVYKYSDSNIYNELYLNGSFQQRVNPGGAARTGNYPLTFGKRDDAPALECQIADFAYFDRPLTATEISNLYNGTWTSIKTITGLSKSSVKTVNGLAVGSVKSVVGLS